MKLSDRYAPSVYFVFGQAGWFTCVLSAARGVAWIGDTVAAVLIALHLARVERPFDELKLIGSVVAIAVVWESALVATGLLAYPTGAFIPGLAPLWILALWALFAAQVNTTYKWLKPRLWLAAVLGAMAGPLTFRSGVALGAVRFAKPGGAAAALLIGWAVLLPLIVYWSRRWDGVRPTPALTTA